MYGLALLDPVQVEKTYDFNAHFASTLCAESVKKCAETSTDLCGNIIQDAETSFCAIKH